MRVLVISDIHANLVALEAVLAAAPPHSAVWCLGDLVGYGPNPEECVRRVRELPSLLCLVGNHDKAVIGELDLGIFNHEARAALEWTRRAVSAETMDYLRSLSPQHLLPDYTLAHGSPRHPVWEYILDAEIARENFPHISTPYCLVGHTHAPVTFVSLPANGRCYEEMPDYGHPRPLNRERLILNPGSVGQPRDSNPKAAFAMLDTDEELWTFHRAAYDVAETQARMRAAGLSERLAARLAVGW